MIRPRAALAPFVLSALCLGSQGVRAQGPDDPFYDWDLERYRCVRSIDQPSGAILPLPDTTAADGYGPFLRDASISLDLADAASQVPLEEEDGIRVRDGARGRGQVDGVVALPARWAIGLAGRVRIGEGQASGGQWLERNLYWTGNRTEFRLGLTRTFWGDGNEGSILFGRTAPPLQMIRLRSVRPWRLPFVGRFGRIQASFFLGYLDDRARTIPYPLLHGERLEWEPIGWARVNISRTILFGGAGRTELLTLRDVLEILLARDENIKGERGYDDSDQKASITAELRLPKSVIPFHGIDGGRLFYEYAGEDAFRGLLHPRPRATSARR